MIKEIMEVPFPLAASRRLISFLTFQISMFFSASVPLGALMVKVDRPLEGLAVEGSWSKFVCSMQMRVS
jgi:hypothetical protein